MKSKFLSHLIIGILLVVFVNCEPEADLFRHFTIRKGDHYANPRVVESLQTNRLVFEARLDESAIYRFQDQGFQDSKNKLLGFSDCNSTHHENSARFAWQWYNEQLEIYAYCYVDGTRVEEFIGVVNLNETNRYEIEITSDQYVFRLNNGEPHYIKRGNVCDSGLYYMCWPYFGGSLPAPHDVRIAIKTMR
jgi:hypothetical protein